MFAHKRLNQIFHRLYIEKNCSSGILATEFSVSERTIRNDITELNTDLKKYQAKIISRRNLGYELLQKENVKQLFSEIDKQIISSNQQLETSEDRIRQLLLLLLLSEHELSLDELCTTIFVGRTTLLGYLRQLRLLLASYNLKITSKMNIGYKISGDESAIRQVISDQLIEKNFESYISQFSASEKELFDEIDLENLATAVASYFPPNQFRISDYNRKNFVIHLAISILRTTKKHKLETISNFFTIDKKIQSAMDELLSTIENDYQITFDLQERYWLYNHLFSDLQQEVHSNSQTTKIYQFIDRMLLEINEIIGENLLQDEILRQDLFVHFSSYLSLKELLKNKKNPLLPEIKKNFSYAFELAVLATNNSKWLSEFEFTEDDIGYLALHIAAAIERKKELSIHKKRVLIICGQGVSTSRLIEAMIKKRFSDKLEIVDIISYATFQLSEPQNVDLIISTIPLQNQQIPIVQIDFLDIKQGMEKIDEILAIEEKHLALTKLFDASMFVINNQKTTRDTLINSIGNILEEQEVVNIGFTKKVLEREHIAPTNITDLIAIPHAIDANIKQTKIFVYISQSPIIWRDDKTVKIIFLLAVAEEDKENLHTFFEYLSDLVENKKLQQKIGNSQNFEMFLSSLF